MMLFGGIALTARMAAPAARAEDRAVTRASPSISSPSGNMDDVVAITHFLRIEMSRASLCDLIATGEHLRCIGTTAKIRAWSPKPIRKSARENYIDVKRRLNIAMPVIWPPRRGWREAIYPERKSF